MHQNIAPKCASPECSKPRTGNSKYCRDCRDVARQVWLERVRESKGERVQREARLKDLFDRAHAAGMAAGQEHTPRPMNVVRQDPVTGQVIERYAPVLDGVCGFAWITIRPGNCAAAKYAKAHLQASIAYGGGMQIWVHQFNQSMERKERYANAFADVLREAGIRAWSGSRMD